MSPRREPRVEYIYFAIPGEGEDRLPGSLIIEDSFQGEILELREVVDMRVRVATRARFIGVIPIMRKDAETKRLEMLDAMALVGSTVCAK